MKDYKELVKKGREHMGHRETAEKYSKSRTKTMLEGVKKRALEKIKNC